MTTARARLTNASAAALGALALTLAACSSGGAGAEDATGSSEADPTAGSDTLTVFAAASLRDVLEPIGDSFAAEHDGTEITYSFAGSSDLVAQIEGGAPADVLVTADERTMTSAVDGGLIDGEPTVVATNVLTIAVPPGNPAGVTGLDSSLDGADLVVCAPQVPCGNATGTLTEDAGVTLTPVSEENSVTDVLGKVTSGQAGAGIVYVTDARGAGDRVETVAIANADAAVNRYPAAPVATSPNLEAARDFVEYLAQPDAQGVLAEAGFGKP